MCKVYNTVGSLTRIKTHLAQNKIAGFNTVDELISFQTNYSTARHQIISNEKLLLVEEKNNLTSEILQLENEITNDRAKIRLQLQSEVERFNQQINEIAKVEKSVIQEFTYSFKALFLVLRIKYNKIFYPLIIYFSIRPKMKMLAKKRKHFQYLSSNFEESLTESSRLALQDLVMV